MTQFPTTCTSPALHSPDEAGDIDVRECGHQVLTVKAIHDAAVAGDSARKVLQERLGEVSGYDTQQFMMILQPENPNICSEENPR